jgi:hypothetical protein
MTGAFSLLLGNLWSSGSMGLGAISTAQLGNGTSSRSLSKAIRIFSRWNTYGGIATDILNHLFGVGHAHIETPLLQFKIGRCLSYCT